MSVLRQAGYAICAVLMLPGMCAAVVAQDYPGRSIRMIVTSAAGSGIDVAARMVGQHLADSWKQPVVVDNRLGAAGQIGGEIVAKSNPDGHTLLVASPVFLISANLYSRLPYDFVRDFAPVVRIGTTPYMLAAYPGLPVRTVSEFIAFAKSRPGKINYGSNGTGTIMHLAGEMLKSATGASIVHVPYKGSPQVVTDVISGQIEMMFNSVTLLAPHVQTGKLLALGVASGKRSLLLPEVPTLVESGLAGFEVQSWYGIVAPARTAPRVIGILHRTIAAAVSAGAMRDRLLAMGTEPVVETPEQFGASIKDEIARYGRAIKAAGMTVNAL